MADTWSLEQEARRLCGCLRTCGGNYDGPCVAHVFRKGFIAGLARAAAICEDHAKELATSVDAYRGFNTYQDGTYDTASDLAENIKQEAK